MAGRPAARDYIVDNCDILDDNAIRTDNVRLINLIPEINGQFGAIQWLARHRLIHNQVNCGVCRNPCRLIRYAQGCDGWRWRCYQHNFTQSIRFNSFFSKSKLSLTDLVLLIYLCATEMPQTEIKRELNMTETNWHTVIDWCNFLREACEEWIVRHPVELGGLDDDGYPIEVEIDESKFFHRKYQRGEWREGHWVFGAVERGSNKCLLTEVEDRRAATLERIVQRWILPGTRIISDAWRGYQNLNNIAGGIYTHEVVVHQRNFVDPDDPGVHTQTIEGLWQHAKKKVRRQHGTSQQLFPSYLHEFLWRQSVAKNYFSNIIIAIHDLYPL